MPRHSWIDDDFAAFRAGFLSITPNVPLHLNLRAVMAPALGKLRRYSKAMVAFHFFTNPWHKEIHVMACGAAELTAAALSKERQRRSEGVNFVPGDDLPIYSRRIAESQEIVERLFKSSDDEYRVRLGGPLLALTKDLADKFPTEFGGFAPRADDLVVVVPLRNGGYPRLGHFVLWSPGDGLRITSESTPDREIRSTFQARIRQIVVRLFANYYRLEPETYLPSYYLPGRKEVTLLSAEIGGFDGIWKDVRIQVPTTEEQMSVRLSLLDNFGRIAARAVEANRGRIDQNWGSGLLAVFGEYQDMPDSSPRIGLKEALTTASLMVKEFSAFAGTWMEAEFRAIDFMKYETRVPRTPILGIGIDWAPVVFDYFGSADHRTFLAVGDRVSFVKALAGIAGTSEEFRKTPILLHRSAEQHARDIVKDAQGFLLSVPGAADRSLVFPISADNLMIKSRALNTLRSSA